MAVSATDLYIQDFATNEATCCPITGWMHDNPEDVKIAQFAALFFGALALVTLPITFSVSVTLGVFMIAAGALSLLASLASWVFLNYVTCSPHDMRTHVFTEASCEGGRLYYKGDVPILELHSNNSEKNGWAHGYLLGKEIDELYTNMEFAIHTVLRQPKADALPLTLAKVKAKIPAHHMQELEGLSKGFNAWAEENGKARRLSVDDFLLIHLIPDSKYFHPSEAEQELAAQQPALIPAMACTTIVQRDQKGQLIFGRNMDWCPFGQGGAKSLLIVWKNPAFNDFAAFTIPGMIGVVTGWNNQKTCVAMNVCPGARADEGIPAVLFNRSMLEWNSQQHVYANISEPLGPYHLTAADNYGRARVFSFYQGPKKSTFEREVTFDDDKPLFTVNWCYPECEGGYFNSQERVDLLGRYFDGAAREIPAALLDKQKLVQQALRLRPYVNSFITMHSLVFQPQSDRVEISWDNGYAASQQSAQLSLSEVFN